MNPDLYSELYEDAQATIKDLTLQLYELENENAELRRKLEEYQYGF